jgi:geranylgeranyl pyrophosphate synthase
VDAGLNARLDRLLTPRHAAWPEQVRRALRPGKLFRGRLSLRISGLYDVAPEAGLGAAAAAELLHLASLIHDDLIDASPTRRGRPAVHTVTGLAGAVLTGDFVIARSAAAAASVGSACAATWAETLAALTEGQLLEPADLSTASPDDHERYCALKTAALIAGTAAMAAISQRCDPADVNAWADFGHHVGMAFQAADDLLDHIGDPARLGKPVGTDLPRGIVSVGVWAALPGTTTVGELSLDELQQLARSDAACTAAVRAVDGHLQRAAEAAPRESGADDVIAFTHPAVVRMLLDGVEAGRRPLVAELDSWLRA